MTMLSFVPTFRNMRLFAIYALIGEPEPEPRLVCSISCFRCNNGLHIPLVLLECALCRHHIHCMVHGRHLHPPWRGQFGVSPFVGLPLAASACFNKMCAGGVPAELAFNKHNAPVDRRYGLLRQLLDCAASLTA